METVTLPAFKLIGISVRTTNQNQQALKDIEQLWQQFMGNQILDKIPNKIDHTVYSMYTDYESDYMAPYTAIIGCKVAHTEEVPEGMVAKAVQEGTYCKTVASGAFNDGFIGRHWSKIWNMDLSRTYQADFEVLGEKAQDPNNAEVDFYVSIAN